jgi:hypothetical protein
MCCSCVESTCAGPAYTANVLLCIANLLLMCCSCVASTCTSPAYTAYAASIYRICGLWSATSTNFEKSVYRDSLELIFQTPLPPPPLSLSLTLTLSLTSARALSPSRSCVRAHALFLCLSIARALFRSLPLARSLSDSWGLYRRLC